MYQYILYCKSRSELAHFRFNAFQSFSVGSQGVSKLQPCVTLIERMALPYLAKVIIGKQESKCD